MHASLLVERRSLADALRTRSRDQTSAALPLLASIREREAAVCANHAQRIAMADEQLAEIDALVRLYCERAVLGDEELESGAESRIDDVIVMIDADDAIDAEVSREASAAQL
ncbi:MAG: hypothetical protein ACM31C_31550 [Acidobacteriota bacterium]